MCRADAVERGLELRRVAAALLTLAVLASSLPWEASLLSAADTDVSVSVDLPVEGGGDPAPEVPPQDECACLCPLCPVAATRTARPAGAPGSTPPPAVAMLNAASDVPHSNDDLSRLFRPPRRA